MLGIGADHKNSVEGLAWKQNKDFENLLRRLNADGEGGDEVEMSKIDGFAKATEVQSGDWIGIPIIVEWSRACRLVQTVHNF